jgi:hypothetical protein
MRRQNRIGASEGSDRGRFSKCTEGWTLKAWEGFRGSDWHRDLVIGGDHAGRLIDIGLSIDDFQRLNFIGLDNNDSIIFCRVNHETSTSGPHQKIGMIDRIRSTAYGSDIEWQKWLVMQEF